MQRNGFMANGAFRKRLRIECFWFGNVHKKSLDKKYEIELYFLLRVRNHTGRMCMEFYINAQMQRFNLLMSEIDTAYHDAALKLGMSDSAMLVLYTLCSCGGECMLGDITSGASKQTINSALRKLESEGIVYLEVFEGRKKKVYLTEKGRQLARGTVLRVIEAENEIFASWSDEERSIYIDLTQRYLADFKEKVKEM